MATIKDLKKYIGRSIDDYGGCTSPDYNEFQKKYKSYLKSVAKSVNGELVSFSPNHYCFSCFIKRNEKFMYLSISDVRHFKNNWHKFILVRTAKDKNDYKGGMNDYATLDTIADKIIELTK